MIFKYRLFALTIITFTAFFTLNSYVAAQGMVCTAKNLSGLLEVDHNTHRKKRLEVNLGRTMEGAEIDGYYVGQSLTAIKAAFFENGGEANMNFYFLDRENYLMEYHTIQNSNFFDEADSVVLTDEKSYYHVCDGMLLTPAFEGVIDEDIYENLKLVLDIILTEESNQ